MPKLSTNERNERARQLWLKQSSSGRTRYILIHGTTWGVLFFLTFTAFQIFAHHDGTYRSPFYLLFALAISLAAGWPVGMSLWNSNEKRWKNHS